MISRIKIIAGVLLAGSLLLASNMAMAADKPNILVIWGDDVGQQNISAYHRGMMGGTTPNIDRIANEGVFPVRPCETKIGQELRDTPR